MGVVGRSGCCIVERTGGQRLEIDLPKGSSLRGASLKGPRAPIIKHQCAVISKGVGEGLNESVQLCPMPCQPRICVTVP
jgi:hypothetical protein